MNIFENAKFGDRFRTKGGGTAIFLEENEEGITVMYDEICMATVSVSGCLYDCGGSEYESDYDIISRLEEPVDEKRLNACK